MQCVSVWAQSHNYVDTYLTYWIPWQVVQSYLISCYDGTLDLQDGNSDDYIRDTLFDGMEYFKIKKTGANGFEADKFMISNSTSYNYDLNQDIRFNIGDEVDIFTFFRESDGAITANHGLRRTLSAV